MLLQIDMTLGSQVGNNFYLNNIEYSAYPNEAEVILNDGVALLVDSVTMEKNKETGTVLNVVRLSMDADKIMVNFEISNTF